MKRENRGNKWTATSERGRSERAGARERRFSLRFVGLRVGKGHGLLLHFQRTLRVRAHARSCSRSQEPHSKPGGAVSARTLRHGSQSKEKDGRAGAARRSKKAKGSKRLRAAARRACGLRRRICGVRRGRARSFLVCGIPLQRVQRSAAAIPGPPFEAEQKRPVVALRNAREGGARGNKKPSSDCPVLRAREMCARVAAALPLCSLC